MRIPAFALAAAFAVFSLAPALAADPVFTIIIKDHKFEPSRIEVPAGQKIQLLVKNMDASSEEFESPDLKREKVIGGGKEATIFVGPLKPGTYRFVGEYHEATAKGELVAK
jgi:plastocyanin